MPTRRWNFKQNRDAEYCCQMAKDFHAAFSLSTDNRHITAVDAGCVARGMGHGLNEKLEVRIQDVEERSQRLDAKHAELKRELGALEAVMQAVSQKLNGGGQ